MNDSKLTQNKTFVELRVRPVDKPSEFVPLILNIHSIVCIAPFKQDADYSVIKCKEVNYICELPYDKIRELLWDSILTAGTTLNYSNISECYI